MVKIINFSHPLTQANREQIGAMISTPSNEPFPVHDIINVKVDIKKVAEVPFEQQISKLVGDIGLNAEEWQTEDLLINLPGMAAAAAAITAEIHGRSGHFPTILYMERDGAAFNVSGIEDLQTIREAARSRR